ncbi:unnamed protein product [Caenorhabditis sp. 36 PRJEB53466]|nr:unnamed protein product [Caenorhabditis sp. 36 PRJEB53466]
MFRDLGRVHIASFAVGIVGLVVGIVGIVLAIVFGTASCATPTTPAPVTCPPIIATPCSAKLFSISTGITDMPWNETYSDTTNPMTQNAIKNIQDSLQTTLNSGLNTQSSSSSLLRILAATTGPTSNNAIVSISRLERTFDSNGNQIVAAIGNGAVSAATDVNLIPNQDVIKSVIKQDPTYAPDTVETSSQVCNITSPLTTDAPITSSSLAPTTCPVCPSSTPAIATTCPACPSSTCATVPSTTCPACPTSTCPTLPATTSCPSVTCPACPTLDPVTCPTAPTSPTPAATTTQGIPSLATTPGSPITSTQGSSSTIPGVSSTSPTSQRTSSTTQSSSSGAPITSTSTNIPFTSQGVYSTTQSSPGVPTSSPVPYQSTPAPSVPTIAPGQCYYQSNIAVAVELTDPYSALDTKIQNFITNTLLFYPGNPYQLGGADSSLTKLALVPYPTNVDIESLMSYGAADNQEKINRLFYNFGIFASEEPNIYEALDFISTLKPTGQPGFVVIVGNNGSTIGQSTTSSQALQNLGFNVITIGYTSSDDFSPLASNAAWSFKISQDSDELTVAQQIGTLLNSTFCSPSGSSTIAPITSSSSPIPVASTSASTPSVAPPITSISTQTVPVVTITTATSQPPVTSPTQSTPAAAQSSSTQGGGVTSTVLSSSTVPTQGVASSTQAPTLSPETPYYQSNVAVAFELTNATSDLDAQIQTFIADNLFFYNGAPYELGGKDDGKTALSLVPYPNDRTLISLSSYGAAQTSSQITLAINVFSSLAKEPATIADAFNILPDVSRTGPPGFVILVANSADSVNAAVDSANSLKSQGFNIITVAFKSDGSFNSLASQDSWNFKIGQDSDQSTVAAQIGNILNSTYWSGTTTGYTGSTVTLPTTVATTVTPGGSSSASTSTETVPTTVPSQSTSQGTSPGSSSSSGTSTQPVPSSSQSPTASPSGSTTQGTSPGISSTPQVPTSSRSPSTGPVLTSSTQEAQSTTLITSPVPSTTQGVPSTSQLPSSNPSTLSTSLAPSTSLSSTAGTSAPLPQLYYQSNVAVAFELTSQTSDLDSQIRNFISDNLFFYNGNPYELGGKDDGKTALSLVPYPVNSLTSLMSYGAAHSSADIASYTEAFSLYATDPANISDAFTYLPSVERTGPPGFVILVANSADYVDSAAASANNLKALGFNIVTIAFKSDGNFNSLSSQDGWNFRITQDSDLNTVAAQVGNVLNSTFWSGGVTGTTVTPPSTVITTVTTGASSSTGTVPTTVASQSTSPESSSSSAQPVPSSSPGVTSTPGTSSGTSSTPQGSTSSSSGSPSTNPVITSTTQAVQSTTLVTSPFPSTTQGVPSTSVPTISSTQPVPSTSPLPSSSPNIPSSTSQSPSSTSVTSAVGSTVTQSGSSSSIGSTVTLPGGSSTIGSTVTVPESSSTLGSSTGYTSTTSGSTTSQICPNQQVVFNGQIGVIFELLPSTSSTQQDTINAFVENILLNSNFYGLAVDNLTGANRTLVTSIPYPSTSQYNVQGFGSARSVSEFKSQVDAFNRVIKPVTATSDISDALLYVVSNLPAPGTTPSALIIVGSSKAMLDNAASPLADSLKASYSIYTISIGDVDLSPLSSGAGFSFTDTSQQTANQIAQSLEASNPVVYCPPPVPSTSAPSTSTFAQTSTVPITTSVISTTTVTTARPTVGPCQCTGRWVYNGDLAIAFELVTNPNQGVIDFLNSTLLKNPDSYGLGTDVNGNQPSKLNLMPYPGTSTFPIVGYGGVKTPQDIGNLLDPYITLANQNGNTDPSIVDALTYIERNPGQSAVKTVLLVGANGSDVQAAVSTATALKNAGFLVITVAQTASADAFRPLASGDQYALHIGDGQDDVVAAQIASFLLERSFVCFDDGSSTAAPVTRCPGTQGTTQPGNTATSAPVASTTQPAPNTESTTIGSSTAANTASTTIGSSTAAYTGSSTIGSSTVVNTGSTTSGPSTVAYTGSTTSVGNTGSTTIGSSTAVNTGSTTIGSSTVANTGSTTSGPSTAAYTGSTTVGSSTVANTGSTTIGSSTAANTESTTIGSSTVANTGSTTVGSSTSSYTGSSTLGSSTVVNTGSTTSGPSTVAYTGSTTSVGSSTVQSSTVPVPTTSLPACASPFAGKIAVVFELNAVNAPIQDVVTFVSTNLYNSPNYDFTTTTQAINVPYANTDNYATDILQFTDAKSLNALQTNIDLLYENAVFTTTSTVSDGLNFLFTSRPPGASNNVLIVVGNQNDDNSGLTEVWLENLRNNQGYQVLSVSVGANAGDLSSIADKPEWYFQVGDSNGQSVADQIASIVCNLQTPGTAGTTVANTGSTVTQGSSSAANTGSTTIGSSTAVNTASSTVGSSTAAYTGSTTPAPLSSSTAVNTGSTTIGSSTVAYTGSTTSGPSTAAYTGSTTIGSSTVANTGSTTIGSSTVANTGSTTIGSSTAANTGSTTIGSSTVANTGSTTVGSSTASYTGSSTLGSSTVVNTGSTTSGPSTVAYTGSTTTVGNTGSTTIGSSTAVNTGSTTIGSSTVANTGSTTSGPSTAAYTGSTTIGSSTVANTGSTAANTGSTTIGSSTVANTGSTTSGPSTVANTGSTTVGSTVTGGSTTIGSSTVANTGSTTSGPSTVPYTGSTTIGSSTVANTGSTTIGSSTAANTGSTTIGSSTVANTGSSTVGNTGSTTIGSSTVANTGSTTIGSSTAVNTGSTNSVASTSPVPTCTSPYQGKIAVVFELNKNEADQSVVNFVRNNLYNSTNYNFGTDTEAISVPYPGTDTTYGETILFFDDDAKSLADLQTNIDNLQALVTDNATPEISDGLSWLFSGRDTEKTKAVLIVVGNQADDNSGTTTMWLKNLRNTQGYQVLSVSVGANAGDLSSIADKPEWYFQVGDSNGQSVADQISFILCNL